MREATQFRQRIKIVVFVDINMPVAEDNIPLEKIFLKRLFYSLVFKMALK